ncbi:MAG: hypothetical protein J4F30_01940 [Acidobacteria bacterium]|nr:hypothetical protein [Acidobacteriota bacterium]
MKTWIAAGFVAIWVGGALLAPAFAQTRNLEQVGFIPGPATTVHLHEGIAYVSDGPTVRLYDVSDPANPAALGSHTFPQNIYGVRVSGSMAYAAIDFTGLGILDVSDPAAPVALGSHQTAGQALAVDVSGTTVVISNRLSGLEVIDASNPAAPVLLGSYFTEGYGTDVKAVGSYAYVADRPGGLSIVDLMQPGNAGEFEAAAMVSSTERPATTAAVSLDPDAPGATLAAIVTTDTLLELFDVSDPSNPVAVASYRHPDRPALGLNIAAPRVRFEGPLAYIADLNPPFLVQVVDLSTPAQPSLVTTYEPPGPPRDVSVSGSLVLVAVGNNPDASGEPGVDILRLGS